MSTDRARIGAVLLAAALGFVAWRVLAPVWHALAWAALLGLLLAPVNERLTTLIGGRRRLASGITVVLAVFVIALPLVMIAAEFVAQAALLRTLLGTSTPLAAMGVLDGWLGRLASSLPVTAAQLHAWAIQGGQHLLGMMVASGGLLVAGALGGLASLALAVFLLYFALADGPAAARRMLSLLPLDERRRTHLARAFTEIATSVFRGIGATALVHGTLIGLGAWLAGLPAPLVVGAVAGLLSMIPVVGSALVWVPAVAWLAAQGQHVEALAFGAWSVLVVGVLDHLLRPVLISAGGQVPVPVVFVGVLGGLAAFGLIGLFVGPIVLGLVVALLRLEAEDRALR